MSHPKYENLTSQDTLFDSSDDESTAISSTALHWFRRSLRFHDNPALWDAINSAQSFRCVYIIDPSTISTCSKVESNKWQFLLQSLHDLDDTLRKYESRLYVVQGQPTFILPTLFKRWNVSVLSIEEDPTPYSMRRDEAICSLALQHGVHVITRSSHTLHPIPKLISLCAGHTPITLKRFADIFEAAGLPDYAIKTVSFNKLKLPVDQSDHDAKYSIPTFEELGLHKPNGAEGTVWHGGESEALKRLSHHMERRAWVACFDQPKMSPGSLMASPTSLGPYLTFGCLSARLLYWRMDTLYKQINGVDRIPSISLHGQLLLREFYYLSANVNRSFDKVKGNTLCMQVPWSKINFETMEKVIAGKTGFPWIDAIIKQLVTEGWIHGVAKHALISFITYGQMYLSWEEAANLLDTYCLEGDICTNNGIAMLMSGSCFAKILPSNVQSPVLTGKHVDPSGDFIRHYIPMLKSFPTRYIYEPWTAPLDVQQQAGCIIGHGYPAPMIDHYQSLHTNMFNIQEFLKALREKHAAKRRRHINVTRPSPYIIPPSSAASHGPEATSHLMALRSPNNR